MIKFKFRSQILDTKRESSSNKHRSVFIMARTKQRTALKSTGDKLDQCQEVFNSSESSYLSSTSSSSSDSGSSFTSSDESEEQKITDNTFTGFLFASVFFAYLLMILFP